MSLPEELEKLHSLRNSGALTEAEYAAAKARLLGTETTAVGRPLVDADTLGPVARVNNLRLSNTDSVLAGVCGGLGVWSGVPTILWRIGFLVAMFAYGVGFVPYLILWICIPRDDKPAGG